MTADQSVEFALRQGERCRNYGPEHTRTENENCIVILTDEVERLRARFHNLAERIKDVAAAASQEAT